jgi:hypothetical protein
LKQSGFPGSEKKLEEWKICLYSTLYDLVLGRVDLLSAQLSRSRDNLNLKYKTIKKKLNDSRYLSIL